MTNDEIAEGRRLLEGATAAPWYYYPGGGHAYNSIRGHSSPQVGGWLEDKGWISNRSYSDCICQNLGDYGLPAPRANADLICWLRNHAESLLAAAEREAELRGLLKEARDCLGDHEEAAQSDYEHELRDRIDRATGGRVMEARHDRLKRREMRAEILTLRARLDAAEKENREWAQNFDLYDACMARARKMYLKDHPDFPPLTWPDGAVKIAHLFGKYDEARQEVERITKERDYLLHQNERIRALTPPGEEADQRNSRS